MRLAKRQVWFVMAGRPHALGEMLSDPDPQKSKRVMEAMLKMKKIDVPTLKQAYDQVRASRPFGRGCALPGPAARA